MDKTILFVGLRAAGTLGAAALLGLALSNCASYEGFKYGAAPPPVGDDYAPRSAAPKVRERPGLGTQLGEELHRGPTERVHFHRKSATVPDAVATFHYNDAEGAKLMAEMSGHPVKRGGSFDLVPGKLRVTVVSRWENDDSYDHYWSGGQAFVIGVPGGEYKLQLENLTRARMEVVISIDGLNVSDGLPASVRKHGYVIAANETASVEGMRVGGKLRALRFASVANSQAATVHGEKGAQNVGVIGMACYGEDEEARRLARVTENYIRSGAKPFDQ